MKIKQKIRAFYRLSFRRKALLPVTGILSFYSVIVMRFFRKNSIFGERDAHPEKSEVDMTIVRDISFAIKVVNKYAPWRAVCRHEAYQAKMLCQFYNIPYQIFVGFRKNETGQIEGHAWTIVNGMMITGFCNADDFVVQYFYA